MRKENPSFKPINEEIAKEKEKYNERTSKKFLSSKEIFNKKENTEEMNSNAYKNIINAISNYNR